MLRERNIEIKNLWESGNYTLQQLADKYQITRERIRQILIRFRAMSAYEVHMNTTNKFRELINDPKFDRMSNKEVAEVLNVSFGRVKLYRNRRPFKYENIWTYINVDNSSECWDWVGGISSHGFGVVHVDGHELMIHRVVWEQTYGEIPNKKLVLHTCGNKICCNPAHLYLGEYKDVFHGGKK